MWRYVICFSVMPGWLYRDFPISASAKLFSHTLGHLENLSLEDTILPDFCPLVRMKTLTFVTGNNVLYSHLDPLRFLLSQLEIGAK